MNTVTLGPFQETLLQQMEKLAHSLVERIQTSNFLSPVGILLLSSPASAEPSETIPNTSPFNGRASSMTTEDASYRIIDESITLVSDAVRRNWGPNSSYLVMILKISLGSWIGSGLISNPSSAPNSDLLSKTLVLHSVSINLELVEALEKADLEEIRLKSCSFKLSTLDLSRFGRLERLCVSLDPYSSCSIELPSCLRKLVVYVNQFDLTHSDTTRKRGFYTFINAEHCGCLEHM